MSLFTKLYAIARHTSLSILVTPAGPKLSLIIMPKPHGTEEKALATPLQVSGTPEELDAELPAQIEQYCAAVNELRTNLGETTEALKGAAEKAKKREAKPAKPAKPSKPARPKPPTRKATAKKPARPVAPKARKPAAATSPKPAADETTSTTTVDPKGDWPFPT